MKKPDLFPKAFVRLQTPPLVDVISRIDGAVVVKPIARGARPGSATGSVAATSVGTSTSNTTTTRGATETEVSTGTQTSSAMRAGGVVEFPVIASQILSAKETRRESGTPKHIETDVSGVKSLIDKEGNVRPLEGELKIHHVAVKNLRPSDDNPSLSIDLLQLNGLSRGGVVAATDSDTDDQSDQDSYSDEDSAGETDSSSDRNDFADQATIDGVAVPFADLGFRPPFGKGGARGRLRRSKSAKK